MLAEGGFHGMPELDFRRGLSGLIDAESENSRRGKRTEQGFATHQWSPWSEGVQLEVARF